MSARYYTDPPPRQNAFYVVTCAPGTEEFLRNEIDTFVNAAREIESEDGATAGEITLRYSGAPQVFNRLRMADAVYSMVNYTIPRPLALLGDQHWRIFSAQINAILEAYPEGTFKSFALAAAGRTSTVMQRIRTTLAETFHLTDGDERGDLHLRIRTAPNGGWETLVRLAPRPLATRAWRVCDYEGALSAPVAAAMLSLLPPSPVLLNLCCGSGTLMAEAMRPTRHRQSLVPGFEIVIGIDQSREAIACAQANLVAARCAEDILVRGDVRRLPFADQSIDTFCADLPFGNLSGSHRTNAILYPSLLEETARIAIHGARFVLLTHELRLMRETLSHLRTWRLAEEHSINLRGLHPHIYVLERTTA